jgi:hypothetical protein
MKTLTRKVFVFGAALILAMVLTSATGSPRRVYARCGTGVTSQIWSESNSRQTTDTVGGKTTSTQDWSNRLEINSDNGNDHSKSVTRHVNPDGSSHEHTETHGTDQGIGGKECYPEENGKPWGADTRKDDDKDAKGNRKEHYEEIFNKNGKCTKYVRDSKWDSKGNLIKKTESTTDVPCGKYILEVSYKGFIDVTHSTITYGPNTAKIYLETNANTYEGKYEGVFDAKMTGKCEGPGTFPVSYDVTATKEDEFGEMDFSVKGSRGASVTITCEGWGSGSDTEATKKNTYTFKLPAEDGASKTYAEGAITLTFTLKKR